MRVGFVGLGRMGRPMSEALAKAGHVLTLCDAKPGLAAELAPAYRGSTAASPAEIARRCEAAVLSLPGPAESEAVLSGAGGLFDAAAPGFLVIDMTTNSLAVSEALARRAAERQIDYLDAPVSRGGRGALTIMAGGAADAVARARPLLEAIAATVVHVGPNGAGTMVKLVNQAVYVAYMAAFAEGLALAEGAGVPRDLAFAALGPASAGDPLIATKAEEILGRGDKRFAIASAVRYLDYAADAFAGAATASPILAAAAQSLGRAAEHGFGAEDLIVARARYLTRERP